MIGAIPLPKRLTMYLVDTNIVSELARPVPNAGVLVWAGTVTMIALSVITLEEIFYRVDLETEPQNPRLV